VRHPRNASRRPPAGEGEVGMLVLTAGDDY
jgi:hypothetical protein